MVTEAKRAYHRAYYQANRERLLAMGKARYEADPVRKARLDAARRQHLRLFIHDQKLGKACVRCGFSDPRALDFHHRDPSVKQITVGTAWQKGWSTKRIMAEIAKCDVLCANCHRLTHYEECGEPW